MKRNLVLIIAIFAVTVVKSQIQYINAYSIDVKKTEIFGNKRWKSIAEELKSHISLDNDVIKYVNHIEFPNKTKAQLFERVKDWANKKFNTPEFFIRSIDSSNYSVTVQGYVNKVAEHSSLISSYEVSLKPIVTIQVKDGGIRVTFNMSQYNVYKEEYGGPFCGDSHSNEIWNIGMCYPFNPYDSHSTTSAKALVMTHVCATMYMEVIEMELKSYTGNISSGNVNW